MGIPGVALEPGYAHGMDMGAVGLSALKQAYVRNGVGFEPFEAMGQHGVVALHLLRGAPALKEARGLIEGGINHMGDGRQGLDLRDASWVEKVSSEVGNTDPVRCPSRQANDLPVSEGLKVAHRCLADHAAGSGDQDTMERLRAHGAFALRVAR